MSLRTKNKVGAIVTIVAAALTTVSVVLGGHPYPWEAAVGWWCAAIYATLLWKATS